MSPELKVPLHLLFKQYLLYYAIYYISFSRIRLHRVWSCLERNLQSCHLFKVNQLKPSQTIVCIPLIETLQQRFAVCVWSGRWIDWCTSLADLFPWPLTKLSRSERIFSLALIMLGYLEYSYLIGSYITLLSHYQYLHMYACSIVQVSGKSRIIYNSSSNSASSCLRVSEFSSH